MLTYRVGSAGTGGPEVGLARYYQSSEHVPEMMAGYYTGAEKMDSAPAIPRMDLDRVVAHGLGLTPGHALTTAELANLLGGKRTDGDSIEGKARTRNSFIDMTFSAPKSYSVALIHANPRERELLEGAYQRAVTALSDHIAAQIGTASVGDTSINRARNREKASVAVIPIEHYTARPTLSVAKGEDTENVKMRVVPGDPQRHTHLIFINAAFTAAGRVTSLYQEGLQQNITTWGAIGQALLATELRKLGVNVELDSTPGLAFNERMARLTDIPRDICDLYSKRHKRGEEAARAYAKTHGYDFDALTPKQKVEVFGGAVHGTKEKKQDNLNEYESWMQQAREVGYRHRSVLRPGLEQGLRPAAERHKMAYDVALPLVAGEFERRAVLEGSIPRAAAAKGLIAAGIASPDEVNAITAAMRSEGVVQDGTRTELHWATDGTKRYARVATQLSVDQENEAIGLLRAAAADKSMALSPEAIERAVAKVSAEDGLDFTTEQGRKQRAFIDRIASSGRAAVAVGVAGSGKTASMRPIISAWHEAGRDVYGITLAWRQTKGLKDAGIRQKRKWEPNNDLLITAGVEAERTFALTPFLRGVERGRIKPDANSTVVIDEIALIGTTDILALARLQAKHRFQLVGIGDDMQCSSIAAGSTIDLARRAFGAENVPELLSSTRQLTQRERETTMMWREGRATEALERKDQDGTLRIVPGGYQDAIMATVDLWAERLAASANRFGYSLGISVPTNADGRAIGEEILARRRTSGEVSHKDLLQLPACDQNGETYTMTIAPGSKVRLFDRVRGKDVEGRFAIAGENGTVAQIIKADRAGMDVLKPSGKTCRIAWDDLRKDGGQIRLSYGDAISIDARQSDTVTEHITSMPAGSGAVNGFKIYTADSRHRQAAWLVTSQGAEKQELQSRRALGDPRNREAGAVVVKAAVIENMARNLSKQDKKTLAVDFIDNSVGLRFGRMDSMSASWHKPVVSATPIQESAVAETSAPVPPPKPREKQLPLPREMFEAAAVAVVQEETSYKEAIEYLIGQWEDNNPPPFADKAAWQAAANAAVWVNGREGAPGHWNWPKPDPFDLWATRRDNIEGRINTHLDATITRVENALPIITQSRRDAARTTAVSPDTTYQSAKEQDRGLGLE